jgi:hypothetical protein
MLELFDEEDFGEKKGAHPDRQIVIPLSISPIGFTTSK